MIACPLGLMTENANRIGLQSKSLGKCETWLPASLSGMEQPCDERNPIHGVGVEAAIFNA